MRVTESNKREAETTETKIEEVPAKRSKENADFAVSALGLEAAALETSALEVAALDDIATEFLGLPIKGHLIELIWKHLNEKNGVKFIVDLVLSAFKHFAFEKNPHPKFEKVDDHTKFFHFLLIQQAKNEKPKTTDNIGLPKPKRVNLQFAPVEYVPGLRCTMDDEDLNSQKRFGRHSVEAEKALVEVLAGILDGLAWEEKSGIYFENEEEAQALMEQHFSEKDGRIPKALEHFGDFEKDETISEMAFYGIGQNYLKKASGEGNKIVYDVDTTILSTLETRPGYERYGANAFFNEEKKLLEIFVSSLGKTVKPGEDEWKHAKWVWRVSLVFIVTAGNHLAQLHFCIANVAHIASRTHLDAEHPIRRVLKVFVYGTGSININAVHTLTPEKALLHRMTGLTFEGFSTGLRTLWETFTYETFPDFIASKNLSNEIKEQIPICTDGRPVWNAFMKYFKGYVDHFYPDENSVAIDEELRHFWTSVDLRGGGAKKTTTYGLPNLSKKHLADYLTHLAFNVTVGHELNGTLIHYLKTTKGAAFKLRPEEDETDVQMFVQNLVLFGLTAGAWPKLMEDWSHLLPAELPEEIYKDLKDELSEISKRIDEANAKANATNPQRPRVCESFNPKHLETSVSI